MISKLTRFLRGLETLDKPTSDIVLIPKEVGGARLARARRQARRTRRRT
jgi:hypothetical protein